MVQEKSTKEVYAMKVMKKAHILQQSDVCSSLCREYTHKHVKHSKTYHTLISKKCIYIYMYM